MAREESLHLEWLSIPEVIPRSGTRAENERQEWPRSGRPSEVVEGRKTQHHFMSSRNNEKCNENWQTADKRNRISKTAMIPVTNRSLWSIWYPLETETVSVNQRKSSRSKIYCVLRPLVPSTLLMLLPLMHKYDKWVLESFWKFWGSRLSELMKFWLILELDWFMAAWLPSSSSLCN